jgi:hypothetical protein
MDKAEAEAAEAEEGAAGSNGITAGGPKEIMEVRVGVGVRVVLMMVVCGVVAARWYTSNSWYLSNERDAIVFMRSPPSVPPPSPPSATAALGGCDGGGGRQRVLRAAHYGAACEVAVGAAEGGGGGGGTPHPGKM